MFKMKAFFFSFFPFFVLSIRSIGARFWVFIARYISSSFSSLCLFFTTSTRSTTGWIFCIFHFNKSARNVQTTGLTRHKCNVTVSRELARLAELMIENAFHLHFYTIFVGIDFFIYFSFVFLSFVPEGEDKWRQRRRICQENKKTKTPSPFDLLEFTSTQPRTQTVYDIRSAQWHAVNRASCHMFLARRQCWLRCHTMIASVDTQKNRTREQQRVDNEQRTNANASFVVAKGPIYFLWVFLHFSPAHMWRVRRDATANALR